MPILIVVCALVVIAVLYSLLTNTPMRDAAIWVAKIVLTVFAGLCAFALWQTATCGTGVGVLCK